MPIILDLSKHGKIPKIVHVSWKTKDILNSHSPLIVHGIANLKKINPDYKLEISDDNDVENYLKNNLKRWDYYKIKNKKIVEKTDLWRLLKIYNEGGVYIDLDRYCNICFKDFIKVDTKCILPTYGDIDFSQDIMISCKNNPIFKKAIEYNLKGRYWINPRGVFHLGPPIYMRAVTEVVFGERKRRKPGSDVMENYRNLLHNSRYFQTYKENLPFDSLIYKGDENILQKGHEYTKEEFYKAQNTVHWSSGFDKNTIILLSIFFIALALFILIRSLAKIT